MANRKRRLAVAGDEPQATMLTQMSSQSVFRRARCAIFSLWLGAGAVAFDANADPMLLSGEEDMLAVPMAGVPLLEGVPRSAARPLMIDLPLPHPLPEWNQIRADEGAPAQHNSSQSPENRRVMSFVPRAHDASVSRSGDISLQQLLRDYGYPGYQPAAPRVGGDRARQRDALDGGRAVQPEFSMATEAMLRVAAVNVLELMSDSSSNERDAVMLFVAQFGGFRAMLRAELQSLVDSVSDLVPLALSEDTWSESAATRMAAVQRQQSQFTGATMLSGQPPVVPRPEESRVDIVGFFVSMLREFLTNPIAIIAACGTLILWKSLDLLLVAQVLRRRRGGSMPHRIRRRQTAKLRALPSRR